MEGRDHPDSSTKQQLTVDKTSKSTPELIIHALMLKGALVEQSGKWHLSR